MIGKLNESKKFMSDKFSVNSLMWIAMVLYLICLALNN